MPPDTGYDFWVICMPDKLFTPSMFAKFTVNLQIISILLFIQLPFDGYVSQTFILHVDKLINIFPPGKFFSLRSKCGLDSSLLPYALFCQSFLFCFAKNVTPRMPFLMFYWSISPTHPLVCRCRYFPLEFILKADSCKRMLWVSHFVGTNKLQDFSWSLSQPGHSLDLRKKNT